MWSYCTVFDDPSDNLAMQIPSPRDCAQEQLLSEAFADSVNTFLTLYHVMLLLCPVKLHLTYSDPSKVFKVYEIFKEWFNHYHPKEFPEFNPRSTESQFVGLFTTPY